jgi:alpha-L-rhamnosidase
MFPSTAHRLSRPSNIDPAYSPDTPFPPRETYALSIDKPTASNWLYAPGDIEAFLLARMKLEGFRDSREVAHPGLFRPPATVVYFRRTVAWKATRKSSVALITHSGVLRLSINGKARLLHDAASATKSVRIHLGRHLQVGENRIECIINCIGSAATFCFESEKIKSDSAWQTSHDGQRWTLPNVVPATRGGPAPHLQALPTLTLEPTYHGRGIYGVDPLVVASLAIKTKKAVKLRLNAGESPDEALDPDAAEQVVFRADTKPGQLLVTPKRAMSHFTLGASPEDITSLECRADFYPTAYRGAFASGDERLTKIWMHSAYTLRTCMRELTVDGIKRDRMPWVGDLFVSILSNAATFYDPATIRRTLVALAGLHPRQSHANGIIDYTLYWLMTLERYGWYFGDTGFVAESLGKAEEMLDALEATESPDGWLVPRVSDWLFLDWAEMEKEGAVAALQFLYIWALNSVGELALRLDRPDLHRRVQRRRVALEKKCQATFWDPQRGAFVENFHKGKKSKSIGRHANFFAVLSGTASSAQKKSILARVLNDPKVKVVGTPYMRFFENFARARLGDLPGMVADVGSYWGGMLDEGATTFWEAYDPTEKGPQHHAFYGRPFGRSHCHAWASGPAYLLSQELSGLRMLAPQWKSFTLATVPETMRPVHVAMPTPHGLIVIDQTRKETRVKIPKGTEFHQRISAGKTIRHAGPRALQW